MMASGPFKVKRERARWKIVNADGSAALLGFTDKATANRTCALMNAARACDDAGFRRTARSIRRRGNMTTRNRLGEPTVELFAWIGEDEHGSGRVGIKTGKVPAGYIPLAAMGYDRHKLEALRAQLQLQADTFGKTIRLARFEFVEDVMTITPRPRG